MKTNKKLRFQYSLQNSFFLILFLSLVFVIGVIAKQFVYVKDVTQANRSVLTKGSIEVVESMPDPIQLTIFASNDDGSENFRKSIVDFFAKYQRAKSDINIKFINPIEEPKLLQELGIRNDGEVVVEYNKRTEHISPPFAEQEFTNLLVRLSRTNQKPILYLDGHGEKNLIGKKTNDLGGFGDQLRNKGLKLSNPDLTALSEVPKEGAMLIIASPQVNVGNIEAKKIFDLDYNKLDILVHPSSYVHAIIKFKDGMIKIIAHDTNMKIPIFNSLYDNKQKSIKSDQLNIKKLNSLNLKQVDTNKFPSIKIIKRLQNKESLLETIIVLANDELVNLFLLKKLYFTDINILLHKLINMKEIITLSQNKPGNIKSIISLNEIVRKRIYQIIK